MASNDFRDKLLLEIHKDVGAFKADIAEIKVDLKEHMRRTTILEVRTDKFQRLLYMFNGASIVVTGLFAALKYWFKVI